MTVHKNKNLLEQLVDDSQRQFQNQFGSPPMLTAIAPGRVNLIGEHIDYNDGIVLPFAIDRYTSVTGRLNSASNSYRFFSSQSTNVVEIDSAQPLRPIQNSWTNYMVGVLAGFQERGFTIRPFDVFVHSNIPTGAGLSSSAALEVATATWLEGMLDTQLDPKEKALLCQKAEHDFAGVPCGIMDQFASVFGQENCLVKIDCQDQSVEQINMRNSENHRFLIANSKAAHELADGEYAKRRAESLSALQNIGKDSYRKVDLEQLDGRQHQLSETEMKRARHIVTEIQRTFDCCAKLEKNAWSELGELLYASHESLKTDFEVSCTELDTLVEIAQSIGPENGMVGSRMTGGGFGGCTISIVESNKIDSVAEAISSQYLQRCGIEPDIFVTVAAHGPKLITA